MVNFKRLVLGALKELGVQISVASGSVFEFLFFGLLCTVVQSVIPDSRLFVLQKSYNSRYSLDSTYKKRGLPVDFRVDRYPF